MSVPSPGIHPMLDLSPLYPTERDIVVQALSKVWFVTYVRKQDFKFTTYCYVFAKPTAELNRLFHLEREVLVLFEAGSTHHARTLDFIDKLMVEYSNRLDKLCVILISRDKDIELKIKQLTNETPELRVIVPIPYDEFKGISVDAQTRRLKDYFFTRDLFSFSGPLKQDTYFFGRAEVVAHYYDKYKSGENAGLFGLRRTGKTSVLFALRRHLGLREEPFVYIDSSDTGFHMCRWNEALHYIASKAAEQLGAPPDIVHDVEDYKEKLASDTFEQDMRKLQDMCDKKRILITLDEIESITYQLSPSSHWSEGKDSLFFWQTLRAIFQRTGGLFSVIVTGVNPRCVEIPTIAGHDNPIYGYIVPRYLSLFNVTHVREMVSSIGRYMGLTFDEEVYTYLTEDYGGHPFLIRNVCSVIHQGIRENRPYNFTKFRYKSLRNVLHRSISDYIALILTVLRERYPEEYEMLEYLATGRLSEFQEMVALSPSFIEHLIGYGLIREDAGKYYFTIRSVEEFVQTQTKLEKVPTTREEKWAEVCVRRNGLELDLRRSVKLVARTKYGEVKAREDWLSVIGSPRKEKYGTKNLNDLLDANSSEVYLEDIRKFVRKQWSDFEMIFRRDQEKFNFYMEFINRYRVDAHAKDISDEDLDILFTGVKWLSSAVREYLV